MIDHWTLFLTVVNKKDIFIDPKRCRVQLNPYQIRHINLKRRTNKYKLLTQLEYSEQVKHQVNSKEPFSNRDMTDDVSGMIQKMEVANNLVIKPQRISEGVESDVQDMIADPLAAQMTLQFAVNVYNECSNQRDVEMNPLLKTALENLARFRRELIKSEAGEGSLLQREPTGNEINVEYVEGLPDPGREDETAQLISRK